MLLRAGKASIRRRPVNSTLGSMFRFNRPEPTPTAIAALGIAIAGYSIFTTNLTLPKESDLVQIEGMPTEVAKSRYQLTFLVTSAAGKRVLHYPHSHGDSPTIRNLLEKHDGAPMRFGYLPSSAAKNDTWGNTYDTLYLLKVGEVKIISPSEIRSHRLQGLGIGLAMAGAILFVAWRQARKSS